MGSKEGVGGAYTWRIVESMRGKDLLAIRIRLGLTQAGLAERLGVTPNSVARWERNEMAIRKTVALHVKLLADTSVATRAVRVKKRGLHPKTSR